MTASTSPKSGEGKAAMEPVAEPEKDKGEQFVQYIGPATRRIISSSDWLAADVKDMPTTEWNFQNGMKVPASKMSSEALDYLKRDGSFRLLD